MSAVTHLPQRSTIRTVALDDITIDLAVQRKEGVEQRRVDKMTANFQPDALGIFILSQRRNGTLVCLDGMHRRAAALAAGWRHHIDARVFTGLTLSEEAALFLLYNDKKDPSAISRFHARVLADDEVAVDMNRIITEHGWRVGSQKSDKGVLSAIQKAEAIYRNGSGTLPDSTHPNLLNNVLAVITAAWGHDPKGTTQVPLGGTAQLLGRFGKSVDFKKLIDVMQGNPPERLSGKARMLTDVQGGTTQAAFAKVLVGLYNAKRRTNLLPEWVWVR